MNGVQILPQLQNLLKAAAETSDAAVLEEMAWLRSDGDIGDLSHVPLLIGDGNIGNGKASKTRWLFRIMN